jgi:hypothetical protein
VGEQLAAECEELKKSKEGQKEGMMKLETASTTPTKEMDPKEGNEVSKGRKPQTWMSGQRTG